MAGTINVPATMSSLVTASPLARRYEAMLVAAFPTHPRLHEPESWGLAGGPMHELAWQSRWFAGDFGREFTTTDGRTVEIIQLGWWNHGAGPDFRDCAVSIDGRVSRGSIELDCEARDWERHGHAENPVYEDVVLHLFLHAPETEWFTRTLSHRQVPQVKIIPPESASPALPNQPAAKPGRCSGTLAGWSDERITSLLTAAARFRLELKSARWQRIAQAHGWEQAIFQGLAEALGYSRNRLPMTILAQRFPLQQLQKHPREQEAWLFGAAGYLDGFAFDQADAQTKSYLRTLWEVWWKYRAERLPDASRPLPTWHAGGTRPANHPQRRIAALSAIVSQWSRLRTCLKPAEAFVEKDFRAVLTSLSHPYWDHHYTLTSQPQSQRMALLGGTRITDILANVIYPWLIPEREMLWNSYCRKTAPLDNEKTKRAALRLFGPRTDLAETHTRTIFQQQALLQIYQDFCCCDATDCAACPFPEQLHQWS